MKMWLFFTPSRMQKIIFIMSNLQLNEWIYATFIIVIVCTMSWSGVAHPKPLMIGGAGWIWSAAGRMVAITFTFDPRPASHQVHRQLLGHFRLRQHSEFPGVLREWWGALCWLFFWSFASLTIKLYSLAPQHPGEPERVAVKIWIYRTVVELHRIW